ncbi:hypothetical protein [Streptomyces acidicola]|uniref:hypothetical protein n=1 Tax=Streptomyces acidicola TaxID=2596892 RepID=UPI0034257BA6
MAELAAAANAPGAETAAVADQGREVAVAAMKTRGPWSRAAAEVALAGTDQEVISYVRHGWDGARTKDQFARAENLALTSESAEVRDAAQTAIEGDAAAVETFLESGQHQAMANDYRVEIVQLMEKGGPQVKKDGQAALNAGTVDALRAFITAGQHTARTNDYRVQAVQLMESGTPELKAAAQVALEGPLISLYQFIEQGQFKAVRQDQLAATHEARIQYLISGAASVAATAQQDAHEAARVAAVARQAASEAQDAADRAQESAADAKQYAEDAKRSADAAAASAAEAAESARTARAAEADAKQAAIRAGVSAASAQASATAARGSADAAWASATAARKSAIEAGKDAEAAGKAADEALDIAFRKLQEEIIELLRSELEKQATRELSLMEEEFLAAVEEEDSDLWDILSTGGHLVLDIGGLVPVFGEAADLINCGWYAAEDDALNSGLSCAAAVPFLGWGATGGKLGKKGFTALEAFFKAERAAGNVPHIWSASRNARHAQNAARHYSRHRGEFPEITSAREYVELAHRHRGAAAGAKPPSGYRVWDRAPDRNGNPTGYVVYDRQSNTLVSYDKDGLPKTMNRPAPRSTENPRGFDTSRWPTLDDYLRAQGTER